MSISFFDSPLICGSGSRRGVLVGSLLSVNGSRVAPVLSSFGGVCCLARPAGSSVFCRVLRRLRFFSRVSLPYVPLRFPPAVVSSPAGGGASISGALFGSVLSLASVPAGSCPVAVSLSRFRWPVRSAVFVSVLLAFWSSPAGVRSLPASVAVPFFRAGLASLGFSGDISGRGVVARFLRDFGRFSVPAGVPSFSFFSRSAVFSALSSLARCLDWLRSRGGCPPALRPVLASLLGALWCFCPAVRG